MDLTIILVIIGILMTLIATIGPFVVIAYYVIKFLKNTRKEKDKYIIKVDNVDTIEFIPAKTEKTIKKEIIERVYKDESRKKYTKL